MDIVGPLTLRSGDDPTESQGLFQLFYVRLQRFGHLGDGAVVFPISIVQILGAEPLDMLGSELVQGEQGTESVLRLRRLVGVSGVSLVVPGLVLPSDKAGAGVE